MKNNTFGYTLLSLASSIPAVSFAALNGVRGLLISFKSILNLTIPVIFGLALIYFFWGTAQFILHSGDSKTRDEGKQKMIWGIVALFVMVSIWGILGAIGGAIGIPVGGGLPGYVDCSTPGSC